MSAYASLPGSFLPLFAFGALATADDDDPKPKTSGDTSREHAEPKAKDTLTFPPSSTARSSSNEAKPSAFKALTLSSDNLKEVLPTPSSSQPSDIIIAIRSARVDPVQLIKSLTSKGSNIARRTASFISRKSDEDSGSAASESASTTDAHKEDTIDTTNAENATSNSKGGYDEASTFSGPGLCYEDTDSDEEYSMYDYSEDFSAPNDDDDINEFQHNEQENATDHHNPGGGDPSSIEFELSISFQGRKYNATRTFPTFVKLRNDLLRELKVREGGEGEMKHGLHYRRNKRNAGGGKSPTNVPEDKDGCMGKAIPAHLEGGDNESVSVPELPRVSPESLGHTGFALSGVARSGFALLQATAQHYCPEMESWMRQVIDAFPCSQSLSSFLWEPLSSSNANWETIGEGNELDGSCGNFSPLVGMPAAFTNKPPPTQSRSKPRSSNFKTSNRYKMKGSGSVGSLNSIEEGDDYDDDDHSL